MAEIWIQEEKLTDTFLDNIGHYIKIEGNTQSIYFINECSEEDNYVDRNRRFLQDFLLFQNRYPIYVTFVSYDDNTEDFITLFKKNSIDYELNFLQEQRTYYTLFQKHKYHPPCFTVTIMEPRSLLLTIEETYWLPAQNEFYAISYSDNLLFQLARVKEWGRVKERSIPCFFTGVENTFITLFHDGDGFYLYSNEERYSTIGNLCSQLPRGTIIAQINDSVL
ncbi:hypothetical protein [Bacillus sp. Marseille-P3661]|uniref:hypothetical protein n=1 Tax=Bacillus sp. Marseille-P3661 TaxID=1936234 RepID=UPI000C84D164|nr:hypothetical protein [Bacillus sp. Marseille-P3661]